MATNPTKILLYDLDASLGKIVDDLKTFQGTYPTLLGRLTDLTSDTFSDAIKAVIDDLLAGYENGSVHVIKRIENLKKDLGDLQEALELATIIESQKYEEYIYDVGGNVTNEIAYMDNTKTLKIYEVTYVYNNPTDAVLQSSQKKVYDEDGATLLQTVNKAYEYNVLGDIKGVNTTII